MSARAVIPTEDDTTRLPLRMTTAEVCQLANCSVTTLWRRRREDPAWLPASTVQLSKSTMFDRDAVLSALGLRKDDTSNDPWAVDPDAIREARSRQIRHASAARRRDVPRAYGGSPKAPALRVVASHPPAR